MENTSICINCKHCSMSENQINYMCKITKDLITGKTGINSCYYERYHGICGPTAVNFDKK